MRGDETERRIVESASTPSEAAAAIFFYRRGDATEVLDALRLADRLEDSLDEDDMVIARRGDLTINQPRGLIGRRVVWRTPAADGDGTDRHYGHVDSAVVRFNDVGDQRVDDRDDVRLVVPHSPAPACGRRYSAVVYEDPTPGSSFWGWRVSRDGEPLSEGWRYTADAARSRADDEIVRLQEADAAGAAS